MKMKRIILLFATSILLVNLFAQENEAKPEEKKNKDYQEDEAKLFRLGVHTAPQFYFWNGATFDNVESTYKFAYNQDIALVFTAKFGSVFEMKTGLGYSSKNFKREEACLICGNDVVEGSSFKINYIEIPLLANLYFYNSRLDAYGIIGIKNSFLLGAKNKHRANINNEVETVFNVKEDFAKYLIGIQGGFGVNYNLTYTLSLTGEVIYNFNPIQFEPSSGLNFHSLGINLGINFKL